MKYFLLVILLISMFQNDPSKYMEMLQNKRHELHRSDLELNDTFLRGFDTVFYHSPSYPIYCGRLAAFKIRGTKNDTLYDIAIVYKDNKLYSSYKNSRASIYMKESSIKEKYFVGGITLSHSSGNCISIDLFRCTPYRIDTLKDKFVPDYENAEKKETVLICP